MNKQDLANAFDLLGPSQEDKYNIKNAITKKTEGRKPFLKRFKRPVVAMTCFAIASILVITACAAGGIELFSLIYGSEVSKYEKYISEASEPVSTENVSFTLEGVLYDGYNGVAVVSLKALNETGRGLIEQFNQDITFYKEGGYGKQSRIGWVFYYQNPAQPDDDRRVVCSDHMIISKDKDGNFSMAGFTISSLTGALGNDKNYYKIIWINSEKEMFGLQIGWTDNEETVLTDFDVSLITNTIEIEYPEKEDETTGFISPYKIAFSPMAIYVFSHTTNDLRVDDQFLVKFTDGNIYDLFDGGNRGDPGVYGDYQAFQEDDKRKGYSTTFRGGDGVTHTSMCSYKFGELVDLNKIESVIFFGVEYKLR